MQTGAAFTGLQERMLLAQPEPLFTASSWELWAMIGVVLITADLLLRVRITLPLGLSALLVAGILLVAPKAGQVSIPVWLIAALLLWITGWLYRRVQRNG